MNKQNIIHVQNQVENVSDQARWADAFQQGMINGHGAFMAAIKKHLRYIECKDLYKEANDTYHTLEGIILKDGRFVMALNGHMNTAAAVTDVNLENIHHLIYGPLFFSMEFGMILTQDKNRITAPDIEDWTLEQHQTMNMLKKLDFLDKNPVNMFDKEDMENYKIQCERIKGENVKEANEKQTEKFNRISKALVSFSKELDK